MKKVCFLFLACGLVPILTVAQPRNVDWIHGLGGTATAWETVDVMYAGDNTQPGQRQIPVHRRGSFNTASGIEAFARDVRPSTGGTNTIAIGHSLGGTAIRQVDIWNSNHWAGTITVGAPLAGAQIATSTRNGVAQQFINEGTVELLRGPSAGSIALTIIPFGVLIEYAAHLGTLYSNNIASIVVNQISNNLNLTNDTADDLNPSGSYMQSIAGQGTSSPKIQIWGREDDPILWRLTGSFSFEPDQWGVDLASRAAGIYTTAADIEYVNSWIPPFILAHGYYNWRGHQWMAGADWIRETSNPAWQAVIGAAYYAAAIVPYWEYDYASCGQNAQLCDPNDPNCDDSQCFRWVDKLVNVYTVDQSDGVVPAPSQRNDGRAWRGFVLEAPGVNHMEMLRFDQISPSLNTIFDLQRQGIDPIFRIGQ